LRAGQGGPDGGAGRGAVLLQPPGGRAARAGGRRRPAGPAVAGPGRADRRRRTARQAGRPRPAPAQAADGRDPAGRARLAAGQPGAGGCPGGGHPVHRAGRAQAAGVPLPRAGRGGGHAGGAARAGRPGQHGPAPDVAVKCPLCETPVAPGDSFCEACGHPLGFPDCECCGASGVAAEGYCGRCGARQTTDRDHAEIVLDASGAAAVTDRGLRRARNEDAMALTPLEHPDDARTIPYGPTTIPAAGANLPNVTPATYGAEVGVAAVVCDGVGSSPRADEASAAAVTAAAAALAEGRTHEEAFALASRAVGRLATSPDDAPACTYAAAVARPGEVTICWAGDTRAYWLADVAAPGGGVRREGMLLT